MILWDLIDIKKTKFLIPKICDLTFCRSTGLVDRCAQTCTGHLAGGPESSALWIWPRSTGRSTGRELCYLYPGLGRPRGRPTKSTPLSGGGRSTDSFGPIDRAVDQRHNGHKNDRWPVDRAVDRKGSFALSWLPTGRFLRGYKYAFSCNAPIPQIRGRHCNVYT